METGSMKIDWTAVTVFVTLLVGLVGWGISVEVRLSQHANLDSISTRLQNIEELMTPMLVDWKVEQELKKVGIYPSHHPRDEEVPPSLAPSLPPLPPVPPPVSQIHNDAKRWAEDRVQQRAP